MTNSLFSEMLVREYYDSVVTRLAEKRIFNLSSEEMCARSTDEHVDDIIVLFSPGRIILDDTIHESDSEEEVNSEKVLHMWLEFTGVVRLLTVRPRQYYTTPPFVSRILPPQEGAQGRILMEKSLTSSEEFKEYQDFAREQLEKIIEYVPWVNEDLDFYENSVRNWLRTLLEAKRKRICPD